MSVFSRVCLGFTFLLTALQVQASIVLGGTRIIYPSNQNEVQITLKNKDAYARYLVQSWMSNIDGSKAPFLITPPVYKLEENRQTLLHIVFTGDKNKLPQDRESLFLANIKSVSAMPEELKDRNTLQFAMKARLKLFWRPASLDNSDALTAWEKLKFHKEAGKLIVKNPTPFYISFSDLTVSGKNIVPTESKSEPGALLMMVGPFSEQRFSLPVGAGSIVEWSVITDYGSSSGKRQQKL
ncbi:TPA: molecular chaperone [Escherichia coli O25b:H4-ST131]|nr:molecular chaperone [Escherichia coli O25b:H4-ST131]